MLHAVLETWEVSRDVRETAELILSELVTNALRVRVPHDRQVGVRAVPHPPSVGQGLDEQQPAPAGVVVSGRHRKDGVD